ncbi:hypothetical protein FLONG3_9186 [Fusarium longipes]|uniref:Uncharacterized protein n=1 Tax=Fusarium longipes TaxID=694270 RepID=A0A395RZV8_9HYPO|nr:hypothetical protein FLONG3_9186 [Fusarium longipes]
MPKVAKTRRQPRRGPIKATTPLSPPASQNTNNTAPGISRIAPRSLFVTSAPKTTDHVDGEGARLLKQAEALATMSIEVNLRSLSTLAYSLQEDVRKLVHCTSDDQNFRRENEERMIKMMYEVQTVKAYMAPLQGLPPATRADIERVQQEMRETATIWHKQIESIEAKLDAISEGTNRPPKSTVVTKTADPEPITPGTTGRETRAIKRANIQLELSAQKQKTSSRLLTPELRIKDAINSTKRWNREHKSTKSEDIYFIPSYFRKQRQRDAELAGILQRTLQKRVTDKVKARFGVQGLEELSRHTSWEDVIDTATEVLVVNKTKTAKLLS